MTSCDTKNSTETNWTSRSCRKDVHHRLTPTFHSHASLLLWMGGGVLYLPWFGPGMPPVWIYFFVGSRCWRDVIGYRRGVLSRSLLEVTSGNNVFSGFTQNGTIFMTRETIDSTLLSFMYEHWIHVKQDSTIYGAGILQHKGMDGQTGYPRGPSLAPKCSPFYVSSFVEPRLSDSSVYEPCAEQSGSTFMVPVT